MKDALVNKADRVSKYIKLNRAHHLNNTGLSQDDLNRLKSLGYIYEKD
ncbi:MAG: hypothetical protein GY950_15390, partial [bacterium]|nr:hypothetical protein [bacterium]